MNHPKLEVLNLMQDELSAEHMQVFIDILPTLNKLKSLVVSGNPLGEKCVINLGESVMKLQSLSYLDISQTEAGHVGAMQLIGSVNTRDNY